MIKREVKIEKRQKKLNYEGVFLYPNRLQRVSVFSLIRTSLSAGAIVTNFRPDIPLPKRPHDRIKTESNRSTPKSIRYHEFLLIHKVD